MQIIPPLDSIYYTPDSIIRSSDRPGVDTAFTILFWAPQAIFILPAFLLLVKTLVRKTKPKNYFLSILVPYIMVFIPLAALIFFFQIRLGPLRPNDPTGQAMSRILFQHDAYPSLIAVPGLVVLHVVTALWVRHRRQQSGN
jgi:hypothetical protein